MTDFSKPETTQLIDQLLSQIEFDGMDPETFTIAELRRQRVKATKAECERCNGTGIIGLRMRTGTYVGPGPVPEDARKFIEATCDVCRGTGIDVSGGKQP